MKDHSPMHSCKSIAAALLSFLTAVLVSSSSLAAAASGGPADGPAESPDDSPEYQETARVARVSYVTGDVNLKRVGSGGWETAQTNLPLVEGDTLATGADGRAEIQIDSKNFVRIGPDSALRIVTLRDQGVALSLANGKATIRLAEIDRGREFFEIDAPKSTIAAEQSGLYRIDAGANGEVRVIVREGGQARVYSETSGFTLRDGRS